MAVCKKCKSEYPDRRAELGYPVCLDCSTEARWSGIQVVHHKTGNETQIVKDPEVAAEFLAKSARVGFGTMRGMTSGYRKPTQTSSPRKKERVEPTLAPTYTVVARRPAPIDFEGVGNAVMSALESGNFSGALELISEAEKAHRLLPRQAAQLREIVCLLKP